jgi:hypothetical protein
MMAYAMRYGTNNNVLLYPEIAGVTPGRFRVPDSDVVLRVETIPMDYSLRKNKKRLVDDLASVLRDPAAT